MWIRKITESDAVCAAFACAYLALWRMSINCRTAFAY
jgi:hypothetical protein